MIAEADAAMYDPTLQPFDDWLQSNAEDSGIYFPGVPEGCFAVSVRGCSLLPYYPPGSLLCVNPGTMAERGDIVLARIRETGDLVAKVYRRKDNIITLAPTHIGGKSYEWNVKEQLGYCLFIWPVIREQVDTRRRRHELAKLGITIEEDHHG